MINHAITYAFPPIPKGAKGHVEGQFFKHISVGIDFTGNFQATEPTEAQYHAARLLVRYLANKFGFVPIVKPLPSRIRPEGKSSLLGDLSSVSLVYNDKYTVWGHGSISPKECPGKKMDLGRVVDPLGAVFDTFDADPGSVFNVQKITDANQSDYRDLIQSAFPDVRL